jgi:intron-binding protein aquarius
MTVAVSRARLGLYILGRREVFEACPELRPAFDLLLERPDKLMLITGEMWPTERANLSDDSTVDGEVAMENVEHLGQYVFEMTNTRLQQLQEEGGESAAHATETIPEEADEDEAQASYYNEYEKELEPDILEIREGENQT